MRVIREIKVGERAVLVRELTVAELRTWAASAEPAAGSFVDDIFEDDDLSLPDIPVFCDLTTADVEGLAPSELADVVEAIREVNQRFFVIWRRRLTAARQSMAAPQL